MRTGGNLGKKKQEKGKPGRRSTYTNAKADEIVRRISVGETMRSICRDDHMPKWQTIYAWMERLPEFAARIARAREAGFDAIAEETVEIADDARNDWMDKFGADGEVVGKQLDAEHVQRSKLRIETRLKLLAKWSPKKYGDKQQIEHSGKLSLESLVAGDDGDS